MHDTQAHAAGLELISFEIGAQEFCFDIRSVREIRCWTPATQMPQSPHYILGVINLRGAIMPVLDLRNRLGLGRTDPTSRHVIVVIDDGARTAGVLVDSVQETFSIDPSLLQSPPRVEGGVDDPFVDAVILLDGRMLSRLSVASLLPTSPALAA